MFFSRLWKQFAQYIAEFVGTEQTIDLDHPCQSVPLWISSWIFIECDIPDPKNNFRTYCKNKSFSHALKMRAAISFHYNEQGFGATPWHKTIDGAYAGNPSLSHEVSRYMVNLQRRKVLRAPL